jgi:hypothetical protein
LGVKILKFFDEDPGWRQFGSGMEKSRIRGKHPGSATLKNLANSAKKEEEKKRGAREGAGGFILQHLHRGTGT